MTNFNPKIKMSLMQQCLLCTARFSTSGHLTRHMGSHGANRRYKCTGCDCSFSRNDNLMKHFKNAHDKSNEDIEHKENSIKENPLVSYEDFIKPFISGHHQITNAASTIEIENSKALPDSLLEDDNTNNDDDVCINTDTGWIPVSSVDPCSIYPPGEAPDGCPEYTLLLDNNNTHFDGIDLEEKECNNYQCRFCKFRCSSEKDLEIHLITHIKKSNENNRTLDSDDVIDAHGRIESINYYSSDDDDTMELCDKDESDESDYVIDDNTITFVQPVESNVPENLLKSSNFLSQQRSEKSPNEFDFKIKEHLCGVCEYKFIFVKNNDTNIQVEIYNTQNNDPCEECKRKCDKINQNVGSNAIEEKEKQELLRCSYCKYECEDTKEMQKHINSHNMLKCPYCIFTCSEAAALRYHILAHKITNNFPSFNTIVGEAFSHCETNILKCPYCEFQCIETSNLRVHIMMHTAEAVMRLTNKKNPLENDFHSSKQNLTPKRKSKTNNKLQYKEHYFQRDQQIVKQSSLRNKSFNLMEVDELEENSALWAKQISKETHDNIEHQPEDRDFQWLQQISPWTKSTTNHKVGKVKPKCQCPYCEAKFVKVKDLKEHLKSVHEELKPKRRFSGLETRCDLCGATFSSRGHMKRHKESHGANRSFKCQYCDCSYSRKDNLLKHISSAHSTDEDQAKASLAKGTSAA